MNNQELTIEVFNHPLIREIIAKKLAGPSVINRLIVEEVVGEADVNPTVEDCDTLLNAVIEKTPELKKLLKDKTPEQQMPIRRFLRSTLSNVSFAFDILMWITMGITAALTAGAAIIAGPLAGAVAFIGGGVVLAFKAVSVVLEASALSIGTILMGDWTSLETFLSAVSLFAGGFLAKGSGKASKHLTKLFKRLGKTSVGKFFKAIAKKIGDFATWIGTFFKSFKTNQITKIANGLKLPTITAEAIFQER